jgi:hypothetical protein
MRTSVVGNATPHISKPNPDGKTTGAQRVALEYEGAHGSTPPHVRPLPWGPRQTCQVTSPSAASHEENLRDDMLGHGRTLCCSLLTVPRSCFGTLLAPLGASTLPVPPRSSKTAQRVLIPSLIFLFLKDSQVFGDPKWEETLN